MLRLLKNPLALIACTLLTLVFYLSLSRTAQKNLSVAKQIELIKNENQELQAKNQNLEQKLQNVNPEQMIRDELLLQKAGEYVVKVPSLPDAIASTTAEKNLPNWRQWLDLFMGWD